MPNIAVYQNCGSIRQEENVNCASGSYQNTINNKNLRSEKSKSYENVGMKATCSESAKKQAQKFRKTEKAKTTEHYKQTCKNKNYFYENTKHRTIPNLSEYQLKDTGKIKEGIKNKSRYNDRSESNLRNLIALKENTPIHCTLPKNLRELSVVLNLDAETLSNKASGCSKPPAKPIENNKKDDVIPSASVALLQDCGKNKEETTHSFISYQYLSSQDDDDYRFVGTIF